MFFKSLDLYFLVVIFLVCDSAIAADCTGITTEHFLKIEKSKKSNFFDFFNIFFRQLCFRKIALTFFPDRIFCQDFLYTSALFDFLATEHEPYKNRSNSDGERAFQKSFTKYGILTILRTKTQYFT